MVDTRIVEIRSAIIPIKRISPLVTRYGTNEFLPAVVVKISTKDGIVGIGQTISSAPWFGPSAVAIKNEIDKYLAPALQMQEASNINACWDIMISAFRGANFAYTAIDLALWDILGKKHGVPIYELLGGQVNEGVALHGFLDRVTGAKLNESIQHLTEEGWNIVKGKIGFTVDEDVSWYKEVSELSEGKIKFQLDGNSGYSRSDAILALTQIEQLGGIGLFEQPVQNLEDLEAIASKINTPLQADELLTGVRSSYELSRAKAIPVWHFKMHKYGGFTPLQQMAALAESADIIFSVAPYPDLMSAAAAHFAAASRNATWPAGAARNDDTILNKRIVPDGHILRPPVGPGLGVELDEDKFQYYDNEQNN